MKKILGFPPLSRVQSTLLREKRRGRKSSRVPSRTAAGNRAEENPCVAKTRNYQQTRVETALRAILLLEMRIDRREMYFLTLWNAAVHIAKLQRIQNSAARLVYYIPRFEHITPVLYRLHWLPASFRIEYKVLILTYKAIHGHAPPYISDLIRARERINYNLRSSSQLLLQPYNVTKTKKTLGDRAFQVASPGLWNGLPNDIRNAKTMDLFKSLVKTHLFRKACACYF